MKFNLMFRMLLVVCATTTLATILKAAEADTFRLGKLQFAAPDGFKREQPRSQIIEHEFSAPAAEGDKQPGRLTIMAAGGTVDQNIERWYGQFTQPDGKNTKDRAKTEKQDIAGQTVHFVDISGTFDDKPGPVAKGVKREKYRMLGAIIPTGQGTAYFKFYGPEKTVAAHGQAFRQMIEGMKKP